MLRGSTGSGSEAPPTLGLKPGTTAVAVLISLSRVLTPWVDSFHRLPMPCVDSLRRWDTEGPDPRVIPPFRSLLSMLMANNMELRPEGCSSNRGSRDFSFYFVSYKVFLLCHLLPQCAILNPTIWLNNRNGRCLSMECLFYIYNYVDATIINQLHFDKMKKRLCELFLHLMVFSDFHLLF